MTDWRRKADHLDAQAEQLAVDGDIAAAVAVALKAIRLREMAGELERASKRTHLHSSRKVSTLKPPMDAVTPSRGAAISAAKTKHNARLQQLAQERGLSLGELRTSLPVKERPSVEAMRSWCRPREKQGRSVPRHWAKRFADLLEAPELLTDDAWPCGIR